MMSYKDTSDIWVIDTVGNEWYMDKHFEKFADLGFKNDHIVTFEPISPDRIKLL